MQYEHFMLQPADDLHPAWTGRARRAGRCPVKPSNSKKPCAVIESLVRNSASLCTWPGPKATSTNGNCAKTSSLTDWAQQPPTPTMRSGSSRLSALRVAEVRPELVVGLLADRAGVEQDEIRLAAVRRLAVAERLEHALHALRVVLVHLAAERRDVVPLHRLTSVVGGPRLPDHGPVDLARVLSFLLDLAGDLVREQHRAVVVERARHDHVSRAEETQARLGAGPGIFLYDSSALPNRKLTQFVKQTAAKKNLPLQTDLVQGYGDDSAAIQRSNGGIPTVNLVVPIRYTHAHNGIMNRRDFNQMVDLLVAVLQGLDEPTVARIRDFTPQ